MGLVFENADVFTAKKNKHKFKIGDKLSLIGVETYPEHNGKIVEITNYRKDDLYGKCYYIKGPEDVMADLNWVYEYRLTRAGKI